MMRERIALRHTILRLRPDLFIPPLVFVPFLAFGLGACHIIPVTYGTALASYLPVQHHGKETARCQAARQKEGRCRPRGAAGTASRRGGGSDRFDQSGRRSVCARHPRRDGAAPQATLQTARQQQRPEIQKGCGLVRKGTKASGAIAGETQTRRDQIAAVGRAGTPATRSAEPRRRNGARKGGHRTRTNYDLWDQEESTDVVNSTSATKQQQESKETNHKNKKRKNEVAVDVAKTGQSYLPDPVAHRSILRKAAAVEIKREAKKRQLEAPLSQGMSAETKALLLGDSDDEDEDDDEDDNNDKTDDNNTKLGPVIPKRANKRTRAQRNQQKRRRVELALQQKSKRAKTLLNQVGEIGRYRKELKRQAQEQQQAAAEKQKLLQQEKNRPRGRDVEFRAVADGKSGGGGGVDPVHAPLVAVALPDEVGGGGGGSSGTRSLRTLQPKGSLARERVLSWADRQKVEVSSLSSGAGAAGGGPRRTKKKRKLAVKGRRNQDTVGARFELLG